MFYNKIIYLIIIIIIYVLPITIPCINMNLGQDYTYKSKPYGELDISKQLRQKIIINNDRDNIRIAFKIGTYARVNTNDNSYKFYINGNLIGTYILNAKYFKDNKFITIPFDINVKAGDVLEIEWTSNNGSSGNAVSPYIADKTFDSRLYEYNKETNKYEATDKTLVYRLEKKVTLVDYFTGIKQTANINISNERDLLEKLNTWVAINNKMVIQEIDTKNIGFIDSLSFRVGTFFRINNNTNKVYIIDKDNNILYQTMIMSNSLQDNSLYTIENIGLKIKDDSKFYLKIESLDDDENNFIALYTTPPNIQAPMKLIDEKNQNEEIRYDSLFYAINGNVSVGVFANIKYKDILQGSTYKVIEDNKSIRNSKILFYIIWFGLVTSFVLLISAIIEYIMGLDRKEGK